METNFTKGNWKPYFIGDVCVGVGAENIDTKGGVKLIVNTICCSNEQYVKEEKEILANANLIATAPNLLRVLKELLKSSYVTIRSDDLLKEINGAINKAIG